MLDFSYLLNVAALQRQIIKGISVFFFYLLSYFLSSVLIAQIRIFAVQWQRIYPVPNSDSWAETGLEILGFIPSTTPV